MRRLLAAIALTALGVLSAPTANAEPPCAAYDVCQYMPHPDNNGPLMPAWEVPGGYGWPGGSPVLCDPASYECQPVMPG
jgi:hypothetical protein